MGYQSRLKKIKRINTRAEANYFAQRYGEVPIAEELINSVEVQENQDNWSNRVLLVPPHFSGKNYGFWAIKMRSFLRAEDLWYLVQNECVHPLDLEAFEALTEDQKLQKHELALYFIQHALDENIFHKIAAVKTSKEAWRILEEDFSERGGDMCKQPTMSQHVEEVEEVAEEKLAVEAEDSQAVSESHSVEALVDEHEDRTSIAAVENPAIESVEKFGEPHTVVDNEVEEPAIPVEALSPNTNEDEIVVIVEKDLAVLVKAAEVKVECSHEMVEDSVSQAEPDKFENSEAHCAKPQVDEDDKDILEDEAAISAAEYDESATQAVAGQPVKAECEKEDELMKRMPMRAEFFPNSLDVCAGAGAYRNQLAIKQNVNVNDDEIIQEFLDNVMSLFEAENGEECKEGTEIEKEKEGILEHAKNEKEGSIEAAKMNEEEISQVAAKDEAFECNDDGHCDMPRVLSSTIDEQICIEDAEDEDEDEPVEDILMEWSPEEIMHYYQLMSWQHANEEDENRMKDVNSMWDLEIPTTYKLRMLKSEFEDEDTRQQAIEELADIDGRIKPKELKENMKKKGE